MDINKQNTITIVAIILIILMAGYIAYPFITDPIKEKAYQEGYNQCSADIYKGIIEQLTIKQYFEIPNPYTGNTTIKLGVVR